MPLDLHSFDQIDPHAFPYVAAMQACLQDPIWHAEGDVWTHTKMVAKAVPENDRVLQLTALYHDVCKPQTRTPNFDPVLQRTVISHPRHARLGAQVAWHDLWLAGEPLALRLQVYALCLWHQKVFHIWQAKDMKRMALEFAAIGAWNKLIEFAQADNAGRICPDQQQTHDDLTLIADYLAETFANKVENFWQTDHARQFYFERENRSPYYEPQPPAGSRVIILCGLPAVGKDGHCAALPEGLATVSLDAIRARLKIAPEDNQGAVIQAGLEEARVLLRQRLPFVWNAQCITRLTRGKIVSLCRDYDAHVTIHAFDRPLKTILQQNRARDRQVPEIVIRKLAKKWEPPTLLEAHDIVWV
jgi:predicted kinase